MNKEPVHIPPGLQQGATIGIAAPAANLQSRKNFEAGVRILHELGFKTKFPRALWPGSQYFADTDERRADEFNALWADPEVDAIMAARGGYGCLRIADKLEGRTNDLLPKLFIGFSDITLLHEQLNAEYNVATLHGPVVTSLSTLSVEGLKHFKSVLTTGIARWEYLGNREVLRGSGTVEGRSGGGNLATLVSVVGTPFASSWQDRIIFLEDTSEQVYRIDRMLTQLKLCGRIDEAAAFVLGDFSHGLGLDRLGIMRHHESIWERMLELVDEDVPVWANCDLGHGSLNYPIPFGVNLHLDNDSGTLKYAPSMNMR